jgi:hypothetical protein
LSADRLPLRLALAAGATLATLLVCEAAARWLLPPPRYHREPVALDPALGFRGVPHFRQELEDERGRYLFELDAEGMRGRDLPPPAATAAPGVSRLVFVGDSFLVGQSLREEALATSLVEATLRSPGSPVEVYNLSSVDYGTAQELLLLRQLGRPLAPEAVVLFLYPANDLVNNSMPLAGRTTVSAGDPIRPYLVPGPDGELELRHLHPLRALLRAHSRLFATLERRVLASFGDGPIREDHAARMRQGRAPKEDLEIFRAHRDPGDAWRQAWEATFALLRAFRSECDGIGARLLVVVVPNVHQVVRNAKGIRFDITARIALGRPLDAVLDWDLPERTLGRFFEEEGIEARLLLGPLREAAASGAQVYTRDEHLSARGHEIAAAAVLGWLAGGESAASGVPEQEPARPVRLLTARSGARSLLDFRAGPLAEHLGDGWIRWVPTRPDTPGGWLVAPSALAVLAGGDGELVLRGRAPAEGSYPLDGTIAIQGGARHRFRVERAGPFAFRFPSKRTAGAAPPTAEGLLALVLAFGPLQGGGADRSGLWIEALGFEAPGAPRRAAIPGHLPRGALSGRAVRSAGGPPPTPPRRPAGGSRRGRRPPPRAIPAGVASGSPGRSARARASPGRPPRAHSPRGSGPARGCCSGA